MVLLYSYGGNKEEGFTIGKTVPYVGVDVLWKDILGINAASPNKGESSCPSTPYRCIWAPWTR